MEVEYFGGNIFQGVVKFLEVQKPIIFFLGWYYFDFA
jgi:hypothetical protein